MGNSQSVVEAYEEWRDETGDVGKLREYIATHKQQIEEKLYEV